ncbi:MAG: hypothetical protein WC728_06495 [Elusimicrobiota bacterium]
MKLQILFVSLAALLFAGCPQEDDDPQPGPGPHGPRCDSSTKPSCTDGKTALCDHGKWVCGLSCENVHVSCADGYGPRCTSSGMSCAPIGD